MSIVTVVVVAIQTSIVLAGALLACQLFRREPQARLVICRAALVATALLVVGSPWLADRARPIVPIRVPEWTTTLTRPIRPRNVHQLNVSLTKSSAIPSAASPESPAGSSPLDVAIGLWLAGSVLLGGMLLAGFLHLRRLRQVTTPMVSRPLIEATIQACQEIAVPVPDIRMGALIATPFVAGLTNPTLYLPASWAEECDPEVFASIVRHEVAHLAGHDLNWNLVNRLAGIVLWPNPLIWLLIRTALIASEETCDRKVLVSGCSPQRYAKSLLTFKTSARAPRDLQLVGLGVVSIRSAFGKRIEAIMNYSESIRAELSRSSVRALALGCGFIAVLSATIIAAPRIQDVGVKDMAKLKTTTFSNAKRVALGLSMYSQDYDGVFPYAQDTKSAQFVTFPYIDGAKEQRQLDSGRSVEVRVYASESWKTYNPNGGQFLYNMGIAGVQVSSLVDPAEAVLIYDSKSWPGGGRVVGFADGHVVFASVSQWAQLSKNMKPNASVRSGNPLPANYGGPHWSLEEADKRWQSRPITPAASGG